MIGKEDSNPEEQPELIITDRRKFNVDGSLREGVEIAPEKPKPEPSPEPIDDSPAISTSPAVSEPTVDKPEEDFD